jgi:hypothetical protein
MLIKKKTLILRRFISYSWSTGSRNGQKCPIFHIFTIQRPSTLYFVYYCSKRKLFSISNDQGLSIEIIFTHIGTVLLEQWSFKSTIFKKYPYFSPKQGYNSRTITFHFETRTFSDSSRKMSSGHGGPFSISFSQSKVSSRLKIS